jgi:DNA-directed RNA polymerase subunit RPC12/RpoP
MPEVTHAEATTTSDTVAPMGQACAACGAPVEHGDRFCNACGTEQPDTTPLVQAEVVQRHFRCETCGAEVTLDPQQRSYVCPFCESTYVVELPAGETGRQPPEFVIGFAVTPEDLQKRFEAWVASGWFRPSDLKQARIVDKLKGVYLPFWSFSMLAESRWRATIGEHWYRTETYTSMENGKMVTKTRQVQETEWWPLEGKHHEYYSGYLVSGSRGLKQEEAEQIKPFHLPALKRYQPYFLAGWMCEEYSIDREAALQRCQQEFFAWEQNNIGTFLPGDTHRELKVKTEFSHVNSDLILLPIYLLRYQHQGKTYRFLVNGQTGKVSGQKPYSKGKIGGAIGGGIALLLFVIFLLWMLFGR